MNPCLDGQVQSKAYVNTTGSVPDQSNKASISIKQVAIPFAGEEVCLQFVKNTSVKCKKAKHNKMRYTCNPDTSLLPNIMKETKLSTDTSPSWSLDNSVKPTISYKAQETRQKGLCARPECTRRMFTFALCIHNL